MYSWSRLGFALLAPLLLAGCGDGLNRVPIQGTLTSMGAPVDNASLSFIPEEGTVGEGAIGRTDAEGKFTVISSRQSDSGIPPGKYRVRVSRLIDGQTGAPLPPDEPEADHPHAMESIPSPYSSMRSPLEATISDAGGDVILEIPEKLKTGA